MELFNNIIESFGLNPEIHTFTDLIVWLVGVIVIFLIITLLFKFMFQATWKIERSMR